MAVPSFLQVAELWTPDVSSTRLTLRSGTYGHLKDFQSVSSAMVFGSGAGLPGRVWQTGHPAVLNHFRGGSGFLRADAAARAGLVAGVGFMVGPQSRREVCVLLCGGAEQHNNVLEIWEADPTPSLVLHSGYYGALDAFRRLSSRMRFAPGEGLPGLVFHQRMPQLLDHLPTTDVFLRSAAAETYGIECGLGIPVFGAGDWPAVFVALSSSRMPFARVMEVWVPDTNGDALVIAQGVYRNAGAMQEAAQGLCCRKGEGLPGRAWAERSAVTFDQIAIGELVRREAIARAELQMGIAIPVFEGEQFRAVVVLMS